MQERVGQHKYLIIFKKQTSKQHSLDRVRSTVAKNWTFMDLSFILIKRAAYQSHFSFSFYRDVSASSEGLKVKR